MIPYLLQQLMGSGPTLLVCLIACVLVGLEWRRGGKASLWAVLGFGLAAFLAIAGPLAFTLVTMSMSTRGGGSPETSIRVILPILTVALGLLHSLAYGFLLMAVLAGRASRPPGA